ncbi:leucine-rich repeat receptor-like kinase protein THICK TASSEL DWARF1 [Canna indica]|uniref:Leucine-rich repeat receptor-like kinase protein THICK TASSEL DWARF1 n=1 Tax=Canna indica TaxID=4628 RepID=A0AAQ3QKW3_9LILI|nr:leucine-rich repeat receptor-like kinase protein THICK TASSEL DWARF1 [Canna indica]
MEAHDVKAEVVLAFAVFLVLFVPASSILHPVDYLVLQSIRKSLADVPGSAFFASWDFTADPCAFAGVLCAGDRVVALSLGDPRAGSPGLSGTLPSSIGRLSALAELSLVPGRVAGPLPAAFPPGLRFLALAGNQLSGPLPRSLAALRGLRTLDLSSNLLSGPVLAALFRLPELRTVILARNRLSGPVPAAVSGGALLLRLDLGSNAFTGAVPSLPPSLLYLSLASNHLSGRIDRVLPRLTRLNFLDLSMNRLSGPIPGVIFTFPLSTLRLQRNMFSGEVRPAGPLRVAGATVDLSFNRLTGRVPAELAPAGKLYLDFNRFMGEVPGAVVSRVVAGGMRLLYLHHNFLTGFAIGAGATLPAGTSLCLQYNCMEPPVNAPCPRNAGPRQTRPPEQCAAARKKGRLKN